MNSQNIHEKTNAALTRQEETLAEATVNLLESKDTLLRTHPEMIDGEGVIRLRQWCLEVIDQFEGVVRMTQSMSGLIRQLQERIELLESREE